MAPSLAAEGSTARTSPPGSSPVSKELRALEPDEDVAHKRSDKRGISGHGVPAMWPKARAWASTTETSGLVATSCVKRDCEVHSPRPVLAPISPNWDLHMPTKSVMHRSI